MYLPNQFAQTDRAALHALMAAHPLGAWVLQAADGSLSANHLPFLFDAEAGPHGTLRGHVARANPAWQALDGTARSLVIFQVIFQGPQAYVTPTWYPSKQAHGKVVPTWNYAVVHAHGRARAIEDRAWLRTLVGRLTAEHESTRAAPWSVDDAPADFLAQMLDAIVGIEIELDALVGKWKVSQNRGAADRDGVVAGLAAQADDASAAMAALVAAPSGPAALVAHPNRPAGA
jgi:transcriptional regulator